MIYIPGESTLTHDGSTLIDGEEGSSSKNGGLSHSHRNHLNASLQQLKYNENKISLDRSINQTIDLIYEVTNENKERPIFYPTEIEDDANIMLNSAKAHLALVRQNSSVKTLDKAKIAKEDEEVVKDLPEFKILKINLKFGHNDNNNSISSLDKKSIAKLLEKKLQQQVKYLLKLKDRIDDTTSKVFVTGDLNAGKSTFCNALLRRKSYLKINNPVHLYFVRLLMLQKKTTVLKKYMLYQ